MQGTKRKHQDLEEGRPSVSKSGRSSAKKAATNAPLLDDIFAKQRRTHAEITTTETDDASAKIQKIEEGSSLSSAAALKVRINALLKDLRDKGGLLPDAVVRDISHAVFVLHRWTADGSHKQRNAMIKLASVWKVQQSVRIGTGKKQLQRPPLEIAQDFEEKVSSKANRILNSDPKAHAHWHHLQECYDWVQRQCDALPDLATEDLAALLSYIRSWMDMRRVSDKELQKVAYKQQRAAIRAELGALRVRDAEAKLHYIDSDLLKYAFTQYALRDLRANTGLWTDSIKCTQPRGLQGRTGF